MVLLSRLISKTMIEAWAGIEPAHKSFADSRVTTSPPGRYR
jgi:hypothetical protein